MTTVASAFALAAALAAGGREFTVENLAPGVDLFRGDPKHGTTNSLVVERREGLLVVDAQPSPEAARALLAAIRGRTEKAVRYLVLSHPHVEAIGGASAFPDTAVRIGSRRCAELLSDAAFDFAAEARLRSASPETYRPPERSAPVMTADGPVALQGAGDRIEIYPLPPAHTAGDLLVVVPAHGIVYVGDLVATDRNPFAGHATVDGWIARLNAIASLAPKAVVPLRGPVVDATAVRRQRDALAWIKGQISKSYVDLVPSERIPERILSRPDLDRWFDAQAKPSFLPGVIDTAIREAEVERVKRGMN